VIRREGLRGGRLLVIGFAVALGGIGSGAATKPAVQHGPAVVQRVTPLVIDVDLRDLPAPRQWQPGDPIKGIPRR